MSTTSAASAATASRGPVQWFRDRSIRTKIMTAILVIAAVAVGSGVYALAALKPASSDLEKLATAGAETVSSDVVESSVAASDRAGQVLTVTLVLGLLVALTLAW